MPSAEGRPRHRARRAPGPARWAAVALLSVGALTLGVVTASAMPGRAPGAAATIAPEEPAASVTPPPIATPSPGPSYPYRESLALTPPMGWNSWNHLRCFDLTEQGVREAADAIVARGLADAGYEYVVVDDCWQSGRGADGVLIADPVRFPSGIPALADYVHGLGLKFGIYAVPGSVTCANHWDSYPVRGIGSLGFEEVDARTFAAWGVDYLKYDWCRAEINDRIDRVGAFALMSQLLAQSGRDIVYSISEYGDGAPWNWAPGIANLWRTEHDLHPDWGSLKKHIDAEAGLSGYARPGAWNDPDMLQIGNGLTHDESVTHMAVWAILAAPLFLGADVAALSEDELALVGNPEIIAIDQDPLGRQGDRVLDLDGVQVWLRQLDGGEYAIAFWNTTGGHQDRALALGDLGIAGAYDVRDVVLRSDAAHTATTLGASIPSHGTVLYRLTPIAPES